MEFEREERKRETRRDKSRKRIFPLFYHRGKRFTIPRIFPRGVPHKFPIQVYPIQLPSGGNVSVTTSSMGRKICPRRMVRSNCRFARSTTYTRPTDVFLSYTEQTEGFIGFWPLGYFSRNFFHKISKGFVFRSLLETFVSNQMNGILAENVRVNT